MIDAPCGADSVLGRMDSNICASIRPCRLQLMQSHLQGLPRLRKCRKPGSVALPQAHIGDEPTIPLLAAVEAGSALHRAAIRPAHLELSLQCWAVGEMQGKRYSIPRKYIPPRRLHQHDVVALRGKT
jgi:hypothetical protein